MSPILVRPVREQLEHDRVIRLLMVRLKRKGDVVANIGESQTTPVRIGQVQLFPDLVLTTADRGHRLVGTVEVETAESVNHLEAMAQWAHLGKVRAPFHLYVPAGSVEIARRLAAENQVNVAEIWSFHTLGDQTRFTLVHKTTPEVKRPAAATPRRARGQTRRTRVSAICQQTACGCGQEGGARAKQEGSASGLASCSARREACASTEEEIALPYLRFSRDKRGYEHTFVIHSDRRRGRSRTRILYWFRTPPGVKVGRSALDEIAIRSIEESNPDIEFDWTRILKEQGVPEAAPQGQRPPNIERRPQRRPTEPRGPRPARQPRAPVQDGPPRSRLPVVAAPDDLVVAQRQLTTTQLPGTAGPRPMSPPRLRFRAPLETTLTPSHARLGAEGAPAPASTSRGDTGQDF